MTTVTVYPITGRQLGPFHVPHRICEECDLTIATVRRVVEELGGDGVEVRIKPWLRHAFDALRRGGWHAPVVTIDGELFSQGVVPHPDDLRTALMTRHAGHDPSEPTTTESG